jgi:hypothetical protein
MRPKILAAWASMCLLGSAVLYVWLMAQSAQREPGLPEAPSIATGYGNCDNPWNVVRCPECNDVFVMHTTPRLMRIVDPIGRQDTALLEVKPGGTHSDTILHVDWVGPPLSSSPVVELAWEGDRFSLISHTCDRLGETGACTVRIRFKPRGEESVYQLLVVKFTENFINGEYLRNKETIALVGCTSGARHVTYKGPSWE